MKLGFLGGSFDPVHHGHLLAAQDAMEGLGLDKVIFVPSAQSPLKENEPGLGAENRLELLALALEGVARFEVSTMEIERGGVSYTVETARRLRELYPEDELYWIIGADQAAKLPQWCRIEEIARLMSFALVGRPGSRAPDSDLRITGLRMHCIEGHACDISSRELRARVRSSRSLHFFAPSRVVARIVEKGWYRKNEAVFSLLESDPGNCQSR